MRSLPSSSLPAEPLEVLFSHHSALGLGVGIRCLAVSILLIARMWHVHRQHSFVKKVFWTLVLLFPLGGWIAYGGLFRPPGYSETPGFSTQSGW